MSDDHDYMNTDDMCPNCVTPWKCNGPHYSAEQVEAIRAEAFSAIRRAATIARDLDHDAIAVSHDRECFQLLEQAEAIRDAIRAALNTEKQA